jgi:hypothetical protein
MRPLNFGIKQAHFRSSRVHAPVARAIPLAEGSSEKEPIVLNNPSPFVFSPFRVFMIVLGFAFHFLFSCSLLLAPCSLLSAG